MAASKSAPKRTVTRRDNQSIPKGGGRTVTRESVAPRKPVGRKAPEKPQAHQATLPRVQPTRAQVGGETHGGDHSAVVSDRYPRIDPTVLLSAFGRAEKNGAPENVRWDSTKQQWVVPSATDPRRNYRVWRRRGRRGPLPFYVALECNCVAEQSGSYICCWHKCAVKLWLNEWFAKQSFGDQLDAVEDNDDLE